MTDARAKMVAKIESQSTEQLLTIARMLNVSTDRAEMLVSIEIERVLEQRLPESEFIALRGDVMGFDQGPGNHAVGQSDVRVTDSGEIQPKVLLDWGRQHGVNGCGWLTRRHLEYCMSVHQFYCIPYGQNGSGAA